MKTIKATSLLLLAISMMCATSCKKDNNDNGMQAISPTDGNANVSATQVFKWSGVAGATYYRISLSDGVSNKSDSTPTNSITENNLQSCTGYNWSVTAFGPNGYIQASPNWTFTVSQYGQAPCLSQPDNNSTGNCLAANFLWSSVAGATSYDLQLSTYANFRSIAYDQQTSVSSYAMPTGVLNSGTQYYWRVGVNGTYSSVHTFTTAGGPALSSPANGTTGVSRVPDFSWSAACANTFIIDISSDAGFSYIVKSEQLSGTSYSLPLSSQLNAYATYYWRVRVVDYSATSPTFSFTTGLQ
jgi:hypothetical protein